MNDKVVRMTKIKNKGIDYLKFLCAPRSVMTVGVGCFLGISSVHIPMIFGSLERENERKIREN